MNKKIHKNRSKLKKFLNIQELLQKTNIPKLIKANPIISEVFKNYVSNAIKYGHDGKRIIIHGSETEDSVLIKVIDFGTTIDEQEYEAIFKRKVQLAGTNKIGRGLGLAIVKRIANSHDAAVGVIPNSPSGNQFYIKFNKN